MILEDNIIMDSEQISLITIKKARVKKIGDQKKYE